MLLTVTLLWRFFLWKKITFNTVSEEFYGSFRFVKFLSIYGYCAKHLIFDLWWVVSLSTLLISPKALWACLGECWLVELNFESKKSLSASLGEKFLIVRKNRAHLYDSIWSLLGYVTFGNPTLDMTENLQSSMFWDVLKLFF
jgi:hypothetical protein